MALDHTYVSACFISFEQGSAPRKFTRGMYNVKVCLTGDHTNPLTQLNIASRAQEFRFMKIGHSAALMTRKAPKTAYGSFRISHSVI